MPTWNNHLKNKDVQNMFLTLAYGKHIVEGHLCKSVKTDGSPFDIYVQHKLGKRQWNACKSLYWRGFNIVEADYVFHDGRASTGNADTVQGVDTIFDKDIPHNLTAWMRAKLPQSEVQDIDPSKDSVEGLWGIFETLKIANYNSSGTNTDFSYSANAAREVADLILIESKLPNSIIDWGAWTEWRDALATQISMDYRTIPNFVGFGLTATFFNGTNFNTEVQKRIDAVVEFAAIDGGVSSGNPAYGLTNGDWSARFEKYLKPRFTETYTFTLLHEQVGAKVWVDGTLIIDQWTTSGTHTATANLTANTFHEIKVEFKTLNSSAKRYQLKWHSTSQPSEVIPPECLYPKEENRAKYETHVEFTSPTRLDDAIRKILRLSNSTYQRVNGKYRFFCYEQLGSSSFNFNQENYFKDTLEKVLRDPRRRNIYRASALDIDSQYLTKMASPISIERANRIAIAGRIDGEIENFETMSRYQVWYLLEQIMKRECDPDYDYSFTGNWETYKVLRGDKVTLDAEFLDEEDKEFLVWKTRDKSSQDSANDREILLREWV